MLSTADQRANSWMKMPAFTALNGAAPPGMPGGDPGGDSSPTIEVRLPPMEEDDRDYPRNGISPHSAEPRTVPEMSMVTRADREDWDSCTLETSPYRSAAAYLSLETPAASPQKRKRSMSVEELQRPPAAEPQRPPQEEGHRRVLSTTETAAAAVAAADALSQSVQKDGDDCEVMGRGEESREGSRDRQWYTHPSRDERIPSISPRESRAYATGAASLQSPADEPEPLNNDRHQPEPSIFLATTSPQSESQGRTPDDERRISLPVSSSSPAQQRKEPTTINTQADPKRRKRNFSNRTKTGCLTCRKRKKKCDETKPECSNCVRGGFICAGYPPQKNQWGKPDLTKQAVQIESKDPSYVPLAAYGVPQPGVIAGVPGVTSVYPQRRESLPSYRGHPLRIEPPQGRPLQADDDRTATTAHPNSSVLASPEAQKLSAMSAFSGTANVFPTPVSAATPVPFTDRTPKEYQRVPPLLDLSRNTEADTPQHHSPLPQINIHRSRSPPLQQQRSPQQVTQRQLPQLPPQQHPHHHRQQLRQDQQIPQIQQQQPRHQAQPHHYQQRQHYHDQEQQYRHQQSQPQLPPLPQSQAPPQAQSHPHHQPPHQSQHLTQPPPPLPHQTHQQLSPVEKQPQLPHHHRPCSPTHAANQQPPIRNDTATSCEALSEQSRSAPGPRRERDEMIAGRPYFQFDKELVAERERCQAACWKFNNSMNPTLGVSPSERGRLFREILQPRDDMQMSPTTGTGNVGEQVVVEAPFHADYGYNISIGEDVQIGRNCHISDALQVTIGNRVVIGPNVSFYTTTLPTDHTQRDGLHSAAHGRPITIGDDCYIGGSTTILGGVNIGHGTTVGAGSVVTRSLPRYTVSYGNPASVKRGIAQV